MLWEMSLPYPGAPSNLSRQLEPGERQESVRKDGRAGEIQRARRREGKKEKHREIVSERYREIVAERHREI